MSPARFVVAALLASGLPAATPVFRHASFADLAQGEPGNAGQNLFVSARGELKLINWFDLDRDGFPDLVINNDHTPYENADSLIYFQHPVEGFRSLLPTASAEAGAFERIAWQRAAEGRVAFLPSMGGGRSLITDLDGDGRPEILFTNFIHGSTHDSFPLFVYWGTGQGYSATRRSDFPTRTATGVAVADLDGNGRPDLVVAHLGPEDEAVLAAAGPLAATAPPIVSGATAPSRIHWQGEDGFSPGRVTDLPTRHAVDVKIADLDGDGHLDLVFLQGGDWPSVRIFPGSSAGFSAERVREFRVAGRGFVDGLAGELAIADLDGDGRPDLAVAAGGAELELWFNRGPDPASWTHAGLPAETPLSVVAADLNRDGRPDLAVTGLRPRRREEHLARAFVYWNSSDGFAPGRRVALPVLGGTAVRAGDLDRDGFPDLVLANSQDQATFDVPTYLYRGGPDGFAPERRSELAGFGTVSVAIGDLNGDQVPDLFLASRNSGRVYGGGPVDSFIHWGNPHRAHHSGTTTRVPLTTAYSSSAGDLFDDGRGAIAFTEFAGVAVARLGEDRRVAEIRRWPLPSRGFTTSLADLDRDGHLDLLVGLIDPAGRHLALLRGSPEGFRPAVFLEPGIPVLASALADLDGDGRLDLLLGGRGGWLHCPVVDGRPDLARATRIPSDHQIQRLTVADLDGDGAPEVIAARYREMTGRRNAIDSVIHWNRGGRFRPDDVTLLPTLGGHWVTVADTRGRGALDVIFSNYHSETSRVAGLFVYSPDARGAYAPARRQVLPALSSAANVVADLDGDGYPDLVTVNHTGPNLTLGLGQKSGVHGVGSWVYWGSADGFDPGRRTTVASHGPHKILNAEPGDILRRRPFETYTSRRVSARLDPGPHTLVVSGGFRGRATCTAAVQLADTGPWIPLTLVAESPAERRFRLPVESPAAGLRYRLELHTGGAGTGPTVRAVELLAP